MSRMPRTLASSLCALLALPAGEALAQSALYTKGHADIVVEYDEAEDAFEFVWSFQGATVGGQTVGEDHDHEEEEGAGVRDEGEEHAGVERPLDSATLTTSATYVRPNGSAFDPVGVAAGEQVFFFPQDEEEAEQLAVPFVGWEFEAPAGTFVNDSAQLRLISATSDSGESVNFALWSLPDGFTPVFAFSTADGITSADVLTIADHAHYNVALGTPDKPSNISLEFEVSAEKVAGGVLTERFTLGAKTCEGSCAQNVRPAPVLGGLGGLALALGLGGSAFLVRRRNEKAFLNA